MSELIRDAAVGQIIRWATRNRVLQYPEEKHDYQCPPSYSSPDKTILPLSDQQTANPLDPTEEVEKSPWSPQQLSSPATEDTIDLEKADLELEETRAGLEHIETQPDLERSESTSRQLTKIATSAALSHSHTHADLERAFSQATLAERERSKSIAIVPTRLEDGTILVDWYSTDDPANPQNWSFGKKIFVSTFIYLYTLAVYMGSAIYAPSEGGVVEQFGVSVTAASLGLALYVLAYGIGPLLFSPLSEIPLIGRNPPYLITFAIFVILTVPTALVDNFAGLLVLRFLQGFFGSPCLATGGASLQDMYSIIKLPYVLSIWALSATCGPALGPIISGFSVTAENWRWSLWEMLWLAGPIWLVMFFFLPETSSANILLRRAKRLRQITGNESMKSQSEIDQANMNAKDVAFEALYRPIQLMVLDPSIAFTAIYVSLCYAIYYSFFEAFPLVYIGLYGFNLGEMGLTFLSITVAVLIDVAVYYAYIYYVTEPEIREHGLGEPERRLIPALFAAFLCPIGLFIFGWTANGHTHWIVSVIGIALFTMGVFIIMQTIFMYLPLTYPQYAASLFAGNDFARSTLAAAAILFSRPMYLNMNIGPATSMLGAFTLVCVAGVYVLFFYGDRLRARSKFAAK